MERHRDDDVHPAQGGLVVHGHAQQLCERSGQRSYAVVLEEVEQIAQGTVEGAKAAQAVEVVEAAPTEPAERFAVGGLKSGRKRTLAQRAGAEEFQRADATPTAGADRDAGGGGQESAAEATGSREEYGSKGVEGGTDNRPAQPSQPLRGEAAMGGPRSRRGGFRFALEDEPPG